MQTGIWLFPDAPAQELLGLITLAEDLGLDEIWLGDEGPAREPFSILAAAATRTEVIALGVGVTNPYVRATGLTVSTALTVHELSGGRMMLGVGAGGHLSLGPFGIDAVRPVAAVEAFLDTARAVSRRQPGPGYEPTEFSISAADGGTDLPLYVGSRGPVLNRVASARADGAFVAGMPPFRYTEVIAAARSVRPIDIALYPGVAFTEESLERQRPQMIWGLLDTPDDVRERLGLDLAEVAAAAANLGAGDTTAAARLVSDDIVNELTLLGEPTSVGERLAELVTTFRPRSIGLALTEHHGSADLERAGEAFDTMRDALGRR